MDIIKDSLKIFFLTLQSRAVSAWQNVQKYVCVLKKAIGNTKQEWKQAISSCINYTLETVH